MDLMKKKNWSLLVIVGVAIVTAAATVYLSNNVDVVEDVIG